MSGIDNQINIVDLVAMGKNLRGDRELSLSGYKAADLNLDDTIDKKDLSQLVQNLLYDKDFPMT